MRLEIAQFVAASPADFITFWSAQYQYDLEHLYDNNIGQPLTEDRVWDLYKWKNGTEKIAAKKQQSIRTVYLPELGRIPSLTTLPEGKDYLATLSGGAIWDIFWLHCVNPALFPIFDQHTYRAMARIDGLSASEIPAYRPQKIDVYFKLYISFTRKFASTSARELDKALFAYGRFLKKGLSGK